MEEKEQQHTKTLISALNFLSRDVPLPSHLLDSVSSIYRLINNVNVMLLFFSSWFYRFNSLQFRWVLLDFTVSMVKCFLAIFSAMDEIYVQLLYRMLKFGWILMRESFSVSVVFWLQIFHGSWVWLAKKIIWNSTWIWISSIFLFIVLNWFLCKLNWPRKLCRKIFWHFICSLL